MMNKDKERIKELEEAYMKLWACVENGEIDKNFFELRETFRNLIQSQDKGDE